MAQTKRKRRTKHRGTAAGTVVSRGRTGRRPTESERAQGAKPDAAARRAARYDKPPTWRNAFQRAGIATVLFLGLVLLVFRENIGGALAISVFVLLMYAAMGYYTDLFIFRRRQRKKAEGAG